MMQQPPIYPVVLDGDYQPELNRFLWLVKWLLAFPHFIILMFLGLGAVLLTPVVWVAVLITGRYPRPLFAYYLGVMRWSWRVGYYAIDVAGTDRYPPFTMGDAPDYPARLDIEYPEQSSRLTALVRWILAIPHFIITWILVGGGYNPGLRPILAFFAVLALLFTGRYPDSLFNLIMGMSRWAARVDAYALLMRDEYPPFSLDR